VTGNAPPADAQVVDGQGKFLIPGLWDMHAHTEASGESWLQLYVANGVTGIRDMGSSLDLILTLRKRQRLAGSSDLAFSQQANSR